VNGVDKNVQKNVEKPSSSPTDGDPQSRSPGGGPWEGALRKGVEESDPDAPTADSRARMT
jgi:hypothetical protein